jgi:uncharacterized membrane protein
VGIRLVAAGLAGAAYVLGAHWLMTSEPSSAWNAALVVGPMLGLAAWLAWQRGRRVLGLVVALATAALVVHGWRGGALPAGSIYVGQHVAVHVLLAFVFGLTLQAGREPLVAALARRVHGGAFTPAIAAYARKVTAAWTAYFLAMAALSLVLYAFASFALWAAFANLLTPLAIVAMFLGEYLLRYRLHPEFERTTLAQAMRAYADRATPHD